MATAEEIAEGIEQRILDDIKHFEGILPERYAIVWGGYIASLYEWSFVTQEQFIKLASLLPRISEPNPVAEIWGGEIITKNNSLDKGGDILGKRFQMPLEDTAKALWNDDPMTERWMVKTE